MQINDRHCLDFSGQKEYSMKKRKGPAMNTATVHSNLASLIALKNEDRLRNGEEPITIEGIYRDTRLSVNTIRKYLRGGHINFDGRVVATLCNYLGCRIEDLLEIADVEQSSDEENQTPLQ
jgi:hypothetical protein